MNKEKLLEHLWEQFNYYKREADKFYAGGVQESSKFYSGIAEAFYKLIEKVKSGEFE